VKNAFSYSGADDRVESGAVASAGEDSNSHCASSPRVPCESYCAVHKKEIQGASSTWWRADKSFLSSRLSRVTSSDGRA
jgi:hypothetical protein